MAGPKGTPRLNKLPDEVILDMTVTKPRAIIERRVAYYVVGTQAIVSLLLPILIWFAAGKSAAIAALAGGWIATTGNLYFAFQAFRYAGARASHDMVRAFYRGEAGKMVIVMLLFLLAFRQLEGIREQAPYLFSAFLLVYVAGWVTPVVWEWRR